VQCQYSASRYTLPREENGINYKEYNVSKGKQNELLLDIWYIPGKHNKMVLVKGISIM